MKLTSKILSRNQVLLCKNKINKKKLLKRVAISKDSKNIKERYQATK